MQTPQGYDRTLVHSSVNVTNSEKSIYNLYNNDIYWKMHTKHSCPFKSQHNPQNNNILFIDFVYAYFEKHKNEMDTYFKSIRRPSETTNTIIIVDNRENELTVMSLLFALFNTDGWHAHIYTSTKAQGFYEQKFKDICDVSVHTHPLLENTFDIDIYNDILEDAAFWQGLKSHGYAMALVIQDDGLFVKDCRTTPKLDKFIDADYVGAPWLDMPDNEYLRDNIAPNLVGNGGLSLRNIDTMINICTKYKDTKYELFYHNINRIPEDVWFVKYITKDGGKFPVTKDASFFAVEQILNQEALGFHKFWVYHHYSMVSLMFKEFMKRR
jgi:hypothetical protein